MEDNHEYQKAFNRALNYISYRPRSVREVTEKLKLLNYSENIINEVVNKLLELRFLNDEDFALLWAESRINSKMIGKFKLKRELQLKGINSLFIENLLYELYTEYNEEELAIRKLIKKYGFKNVLPEEDKMIKFLARNGYSFQIAKQAVSQFLNNNNKDINDESY